MTTSVPSADENPLGINEKRYPWIDKSSFISERLFYPTSIKNPFNVEHPKFYND